MLNPNHKLPVLFSCKILFLCFAIAVLASNGLFFCFFLCLCFCFWVCSSFLPLPFPPQNITYCRLLTGQRLGAQLSLFMLFFSSDPPCSMDPKTSRLAAPSHFPPPPSPLLIFFFPTCFFLFFLCVFSAGELSAAEAAEGAQHGGAAIPSHTPLLPRLLHHCCAHRPPCGEG